MSDGFFFLMNLIWIYSIGQKNTTLAFCLEGQTLKVNTLEFLKVFILGLNDFLRYL